MIDALTAFGLDTPRRGVMRCPLPSHDDNSPSANVRRSSDGKERWHCFVCNTGGDVIDLVRQLFNVEQLKAVSMLAREFGIVTSEYEKPSKRYRAAKRPAEPTPKTTKAKPTEGELVKIETYHYTDEEGTPLFDVIRYEPKTFRQRRRNADGSIPEGAERWSMEGVRRVLYQLPTVLLGIESGRTIYVCEGERDVHAAMERGLVATCNPGGAGKWQESFSLSLTGATACIVADRDTAGIDHAKAVFEAVKGSAKEVGVYLPLEGKDLRDHFAAGYGVSDLRLLSVSGKKGKKKFSLALV